MTTITPPNVAPIKEVARWYGEDYARLYAAVRSGELPATNHGDERRAKWWVKTADVDAWLAEKAR